MNSLEGKFPEDFIIVTMKFRSLCDTLDLLSEARIKYECNVEFCWDLMRRGAAGDDVAVHALEYAIRLAAQQTRLSITARPRWKRVMDDIRFENERVKNMRVLTYQALRPFALKEFE